MKANGSSKNQKPEEEIWKLDQRLNLQHNETLHRAQSPPPLIAIDTRRNSLFLLGQKAAGLQSLLPRQRRPAALRLLPRRQ